MPTKKQDKTKIFQIWGEVLDEGFTSVPNLLLKYRSNIGLKPKHIMLIIDIMSFKWDSENPYPSYFTLAKRAGVEERSVKRITQDLEEFGLLIKTPRFDEETGAQVTTVFDFRPLVQSLVQQVQTEQDDHSKNTVQFDKINPKPTRRKNSEKGVTKTSRGRVTKMSPGGVTEMSPEGVTKTSPKEDTYSKKINIYKLTPVVNRTNGSKKKVSNNTKTRVSKHLRSAIFRNRIFEIYDNLREIKSLDKLVEEAAEKACKEILINRAGDLGNINTKSTSDSVVKSVKKNFPYNKLPADQDKARRVFTAELCNLVAEEMSALIK